MHFVLFYQGRVYRAADHNYKKSCTYNGWITVRGTPVRVDRSNAVCKHRLQTSEKYVGTQQLAAVNKLSQNYLFYTIKQINSDDDG